MEQTTPKAVKTYCEYVQIEGINPVHRHYHDEHYGYPIDNDDELFGRLILEINQAGLSWETILRRQEGFRRAYDNFRIQRIARYGDTDVARLMADAAIIRNRKKIEAAIHNANVIQTIQSASGSFRAWLESHVGQTKAEWVKLFRSTFRFTGGEITGEFLMSSGYLPGAHHSECPIHQRILTLCPPYTKKVNAFN